MMSLPTNPQSRLELYLRRIATGAGAIPTVPLSREEAYLEYIALNGGGGGSGWTPEQVALLASVNALLKELKELVLYEGDGTSSSNPGYAKFTAVTAAIDDLVNSFGPSPDVHIQYTVLSDGTLKITSIPSGTYSVLQDGTLKLN